MKITMNVDEALLSRVMEATGTTSKTKAVDLALRELDRKATLLKLSSAGLGLSPDELKEVVDPAYDLEKLRHRETPAHYGRKRHSR
jgi:Arc/MetJ family transcription regulator